ncbi:hypothetical protein HPB50_001871 [Hyalomma asiaticum]|uniref:Uncharacterized protein n=1 Tax=Hyalomma asiaticum TaxID=266040 RepID=A0ACB7SRL9_HYAAI|nr:hypothetical protein HPB50_001871 [Hyalomma asiaticum]
MAEDEVGRLIRSRLRSVEGLDDYMQLTGVVKRHVRCASPPSGCSKQLDDLNDDCWRILRSFLSFDDVKRFTAAQSDSFRRFSIVESYNSSWDIYQKAPLHMPSTAKLSHCQQHNVSDEQRLKEVFPVAVDIITQTSDPKSFRGSRQRGPFGLPETAPPENEELTTEEIVRRPFARRATEPPQDKVRRTPRTHVGMITPVVDHVTAEPVPSTSVEEMDQSTTGVDGDAYEAPRVAVTEGDEFECNTSACRHIKDWVDATVISQADPCKSWNGFVCQDSVTFPSFESDQAEHATTTVENGTEGTTAEQTSATGEEDNRELMKSCLHYAWNPAEGVQDVLSFLRYFNLDLRHMVDDPTEDPLKRMMQLSLEYGVDAPVSFSLKYDVTADAPFSLEITLNTEVKEFVSARQSLYGDDIDDFYQFLLAHYALVYDANVTKQLIDADEEIADFLNDTAAGPGRTLSLNVGKLSEVTGISTDRWAKLLARYGLFKHGVNGHVSADQPALSLVAYLSRPAETLAMRRELAWNVLRYLIGPKADVTAVLNWTRGMEDVTEELQSMPTPESKCQRLVEKQSGVPHRVLDLFEGKNAVPASTISDVTHFMAELQEAVASVFKDGASNGSILASVTHSALPLAASAPSQAPPIANFRRLEADSESPFAAFMGPTKTTGKTMKRDVDVQGSFLWRWLRRLRAWHSLPPLVQALLPAMTSVVAVNSPADFFRPPFYVPLAPPAYNLAALGQVVAHALAHALIERREAEADIEKRWRSFWESGAVDGDDSIYCLHAGFNKNNTWRQRRLNESELGGGARLRDVLASRIAYLALMRTGHITTTNNTWRQRRLNESELGGGARLREVLASRIAYLALMRTGHNTTTVSSSRRPAAGDLPGVHLSSTQLFFVMHCALRCAMGGDRGHTFPPNREGQQEQKRCMVVYNTRGRLDDRPCGGLFGSGTMPNDCRYI